jgi:hypothetical protein
LSIGKPKTSANGWTCATRKFLFSYPNDPNNANRAGIVQVWQRNLRDPPIELVVVG